MLQFRRRQSLNFGVGGYTSQMTSEEKRISDAAIEFARANKKDRCKALTDPTVYLPEQKPVSVFIAGSPGAGKTESSRG